VTLQPYSNGSFQAGGPSWNGSPTGYFVGVPVAVESGHFEPNDTMHLGKVVWGGRCWDPQPAGEGVDRRRCYSFKTTGDMCSLYLEIEFRKPGKPPVYIGWAFAWRCDSAGEAQVTAQGWVDIDHCQAFFVGMSTDAATPWKWFQQMNKHAPWPGQPPLPPLKWHTDPITGERGVPV
jgi:hypothetical protein